MKQTISYKLKPTREQARHLVIKKYLVQIQVSEFSFFLETSSDILIFLMDVIAGFSKFQNLLKVKHYLR